MQRNSVAAGALARTALVGLTLAAAPGAMAQTVPSPSTTTEQQNKARVEELRRQSAVHQSGPLVIGPKRVHAKKAPPGGPTVLLKSVDFIGKSVFLSAEELNAVTSRFVGHRVDFSQIQTLVQDINDLYDKRGVVTASAILPPQTLSRGVLKVRLVEGKLASAAVKGADAIPSSFVLRRINLTKGDNVVDVPGAAKDITWFNAVYGAQLRMSLQPGKDFGTTAAILTLTEPRKNQLSFFIDNEGVSSTGKAELGTFYHHYSLLRPDDNLIAYATWAEGSLAGNLSYDLPITAMGTRLSFSLNQSKIRVVNGPTAQLKIKGHSRSASIALSQPLQITSHWASFLKASASYGVSDSNSAGTPLVDSTTARGNLGVTITHTGRQSMFSVSPQVTLAYAKDKIQPSAQHIVLFNGSFNGQWHLKNGATLTTNGAWQKTNTKLLPGDMLFQVGGSGTLRGYPTGAAAGDSGFFAQVEAHKGFAGVKPGVDFYGFVDMGGVYSTFPSHLFFLSAGAGLSSPLNSKAKLDLGIGVPLRKVVSSQSEFEVYARLTLAAF